jgi:site-specific recombinase XerD
VKRDQSASRNHVSRFIGVTTQNPVEPWMFHNRHISVDQVSIRWQLYVACLLYMLPKVGLPAILNQRKESAMDHSQIGQTGRAGQSGVVTDIPQSEDSSRPTIEVDPATSAPPPLRANSDLGTAVIAFDEYMSGKGFSENTIKAFRNDLKILRNFMDDSALLRQIQTNHLNDFLDWMQSERGRPCSAKTLARRVTTLKVFFSWLHDTGVIGNDPADAIVQHSVRTPLPTILHDEEVNKLVSTCQDWLWDRNKADARPYVLVSLLLQTGMKKSECANLLVEDIDRGQTQSPDIQIRYNDVRYVHKNRRLPIHHNFLKPLEQYLDQYKPERFLFECTPRNLEYVLDEAGKRANIQRLQVGFETLRWTCAVRDFRNGMPEEQLRHKLGLSKVSWRDTSDKIHRLAGHG